MMYISKFHELPAPYVVRNLQADEIRLCAFGDACLIPEVIDHALHCDFLLIRWDFGFALCPVLRS
jgi:hypothetical protein